MIWKASIVLGLTLCALSESRYAVSEQKVVLRFPAQHGDLKDTGHQKPENHEAYAKAYPSYEFSYKVDDPHTQDKKAQYEERDGSKVTGNYWLIQPDGEKRHIKYHVDDKSGFNAVINYTSPHSSVYYTRRKHHEEADNTEVGKEEAEKDKEKLVDTRQEVEEKIPEIISVVTESKEKEGEKGIVSNDKENANDVSGMQDVGSQEQGRDGPLEGNQEDRGGNKQENIQRVEQGDERESEPQGERDGDNASGGRPVDSSEGRRNIGQDNIQSNDSDNQRTPVEVQDTQLGDNNNQGNRREEAKEEKQISHGLWAKFPSFTIIHDYPKTHHIPVWEKNEDPDFYVWPGFSSWKEKHFGLKRRINDENRGDFDKKVDKETSSGIEKSDGEENKQSSAKNTGNVENKGEDKQGGENRIVRVENKPIEERRVSPQQRGRQQRRNGEGRRSNAQRRESQQRRDGQERQKGVERREDRPRRGGIYRGNENRQSQSSHAVKFTPIPYGQRY